MEAQESLQPLMPSTHILRERGKQRESKRIALDWLLIDEHYDVSKYVG